MAGGDRSLLIGDDALGFARRLTDDAARERRAREFQWGREIERFTGAKVHLVQGPVAARWVQYRKGPGFYVINYELVLRDLHLIDETLAPDLLILDEAQRIKNWRTKIATAIKRVPSRYAFVLSGTPLENRLEDLYSDDERAAAISGQVPIALIDRRTLKGLQRLGAASPAADTESLLHGETEYLRLNRMERLALTMLGVARAKRQA